MGNTALYEGDLEQARTHFAQSRSLYADEGNNPGLARVFELMGNLALAEGSYEAAIAHYEQSCDFYRKIDSHDRIATSFTNLAVTHHLMRDYDKARKMYGEALTLWSDFLSGNKLGIVACLEGLASILAFYGHPNRALMFFCIAETLRESDVHPYNTFGWYVYSRIRAESEVVLTALCKKLGDETFERTRITAQGTNPEQAVEFALNELSNQESSEHVADSIEHYPDGLSYREIEVLRLIAAGKSNREIAGELYISHNTVANHITNILNKTNTTNRAEAAVYAVQHGLVQPTN